MDNYHAQLIFESNKRMIEAMGMHWENESRKQRGESPAYFEDDFQNLAHAPVDL